ncbi:MAG: hypothetical protein PHQ27_04810 [Victivallales bacterium]|nr:hypothetical protein [Victivallales bacterium]
MQITHYNNIDFSIDPNGTITRTATWHVMPDYDPTTGWESLAEAVRAWAGQPGDPWRLPGNDAQSYTTDPDYVITAINCKALSRYMYEVEFSGTAGNITAVPLGEPALRINASGEREKTLKWRLHGNALADFLPSPGTTIELAGELYLCAAVNCRPQGGNVYEVTLEARDMAVLLLGTPSLTKSGTLEKVRKAKWRVSAAALDEFLAGHDINSDASAWAGADYYVSALNCTPIGALGYYVTVEARHLGIRMIDIRCEMEFSGYDLYGNPVTEKVYTGRWQLRADFCAEFDRRIGGSAVEWSEEGFIIRTLNRIRISEMEYEYTLTARNPNTTVNYAPMIYDPRHSLGSRKDYEFFTMDFHVNARMAGWGMNSAGTLVKLNNIQPENWSADDDCPFHATAELPRSICDTSLTCSAVGECFYRKGLPNLHAATLAAWKNEPKIVSSVGGCHGNWRKLEQRTAIVTDTQNRPWTKIERRYIDAPTDYTWNENYNF